jgi:hypothetical protein
MMQMNQIYQKVANDLDLTEDQVREVGEHAFAWLRLRITNLDIDKPKILFPGLGTFLLIISKMKKVVKLGTLSKEDTEKTINLINKFDKK